MDLPILAKRKVQRPNTRNNLVARLHAQQLGNLGEELPCLERLSAHGAKPILRPSCRAVTGRQASGLSHAYTLEHSLAYYHRAKAIHYGSYDTHQNPSAREPVNEDDAQKDGRTPALHSVKGSGHVSGQYAQYHL